jgi:polyphosphate glucokinase
MAATISHARHRPRTSLVSHKHHNDLWTLAIDIGGTGVKASVLDTAGVMLVDRIKLDTPVGHPPAAMLTTVAMLTRQLPPFDRISVGFPGAVGAGRVLTAPNLRHEGWLGYDLATALARRFRRPARVANDVALQGLGVIRRIGVELVITLGTGVGSALYLQGLLVPQFAIGHLPFRNHETYNEQLNIDALETVGTKKWNERLGKAIKALRQLVCYDHLYVGGGNAKKVSAALDNRTSLVSNSAGIRGGIELWRDV